MADTKLTALTEVTSPVNSDIVYVVSGPGSTNTSGKAQVYNIQKLVKPLSDSTTAWQVQSAGSTTPIIAVDTSNGKVVLSGPANITGVTNAVQLSVKANATQTSNMLELQDSSGTVLLSANPSNATYATLSSTDAVTNGAFTSDLTGWSYGGGTDWAWSGGTAAHAAGNATAITQDITLSNTKWYLVQYVGSKTAGYAKLSIGSYIVDVNLTSSPLLLSFRATANSTVTLSVTPNDSTYAGAIDSLSVKELTATTSPAFTIFNSDGTGGIMFRPGKSSGGYNTNIFIGNNAGSNNYSGYGNTVLGYLAGQHNRNGASNVFIGESAGQFSSDASNNIFIGYAAGKGSLGGSPGAVGGNIAIGYYAGQALTTGRYNFVMGFSAGQNLTTGSYNMMFGYNSGYNVIGGGNNTLIGGSAGYSLTSSDGNVYIGSNVGYYNATGTYNVGIGYYALYGATGQSNSDNTAIGRAAGYSVTTGARNIFIGAYAGQYETGSDKFMVDCRTRTNEATARTSSLLYGVLAATVASQTLTVNGNLGVNIIPTTAMHTFNTDSGTSTVLNIETITRSSSGTPAASLGGAVLLALKSSTTESREAGRLIWEWATATDASRKARVRLTAYDTSEREGMRIEADGTATLISLGGQAVVTTIGALVTQARDIIQLGIKAHSSQTANLLNCLDTNSAVLTYIEPDGEIVIPQDSKALKLGGGVDMSVYYNGTDGYVSTSLVAASDLHITCGTAKTLVLDTPVWDDVQFPTSAGKLPGANAPTFEAFTTNTGAYAFSVDDYIDLQASEPHHGWVEGSAADVHIHFALKTANSTGANRYAKFTVYVAVADINGTFTEIGPFTAEQTIATGSAALKMYLLDCGDATLTGYHVGSQIVARVKRIAATGGTEYADDVYITQVGMHFQRSRLGSRTDTSA